MTDALILAEDLRVDVDGVPACDGLTLRTSGERVLLLGAPHALFEALAGIRPIKRGTLSVRGTSLATAVADGVVAAASLDPPLPPKWTATEYVTWSARLAGHTTGDAKTLAKNAIARVQLGAIATQPLARMVPHARRGVVVAAALAAASQALILEDPLVGLAEETARTWGAILVTALEEIPWVVVASRIALTSPLAIATDEALIVSGSRVDAQGPPAEIAAADRRFVARIHGAVEALATKLGEHGATLDVQGAQVLLDLGATLTTAALLRLAGESEATIVELVPVARALT